MFHGLAKKTANVLVGENEKVYKPDKLRYGLEIIMNTTFEVLAIFLVAWMLGLVQEAVVLCITFALLRTLAGGAHLSTYVRCLVFSVGILIVGSWVSEVFSSHLNRSWVLFAILCIGAVAVISCIYYAPADYYRNLSQSQKMNFKRKAVIYIILWCGIAGIACYLIPLKYIFASMLGVMLEILTIYPISFRLFRKIDHILDGFHRSKSAV